MRITDAQVEAAFRTFRFHDGGGREAMKAALEAAQAVAPATIEPSGGSPICPLDECPPNVKCEMGCAFLAGIDALSEAALTPWPVEDKP